MIRAFIMAAGKGTRMWPLTENRPKAMIPVLNKPIIEHILDPIVNAGIDRITILIGYKGSIIAKRYGDKYKNARISYEYQESIAGTGDAIRYLKRYPEDKFLILNGDLIFDPRVVEEILSEDIAILSVFKENAERYGIIKGEDYLEKIEEKVPGAKNQWINAGIYLVDRDIFNYSCDISARGEYELVDIINKMAVRKEIKIVRSKSYWFDIGTPWDLLEINKFLMDRKKFEINGEIEENVVIKGNVGIGEGSRILSGTYIEGPVLIGKNCKIGPNAYLRPYTVIGDNCHVGNSCEIKASVIMNGTKIPHFNYVGDSVIGENCNLGAGTKIANLRLDEKSIKVYLKGKLVDTGRRKLGAIMGDFVHTGINASIDVGTFIGSCSFIGPGALARGVIKSGSRIF